MAIQQSNLMLDLETFGTAPGSIIRSIGAVVFDPFGDPLGDADGPSFYCNINSESQEAIGLTYDKSTVEWWDRQSEEAKASLLTNQISIQEAANKFNGWCRQFPNRKLWCQGANFDSCLWEAVCKVLGLPVPWRFYDVRDTRTAYQIGGLDTKSVPREGTYHNALDDSKHQVTCVQIAIGKARTAA